MKKLFAVTLAVLCAVCLAACGSQTPAEGISTALSIDVSSGKEVQFRDDHGGFHGDGTEYVVLAFADDKVLEQIKDDSAWTALPLDETAKALVYGVAGETSRIGPFLTDENGDTLFPEIENGYYILIDRHSQKEANILERASFNFTLAIYDTDTNKLHYCAFDT